MSGVGLEGGSGRGWGGGGGCGGYRGWGLFWWVASRFIPDSFHGGARDPKPPVLRRGPNRDPEGGSENCPPSKPRVRWCDRALARSPASDGKRALSRPRDRSHQTVYHTGPNDVLRNVGPKERCLPDGHAKAESESRRFAIEKIGHGATRLLPPRLVNPS